MKTKAVKPTEIELMLQELFFWEQALRCKGLCLSKSSRYAGKWKEQTHDKSGQ